MVEPAEITYEVYTETNRIGMGTTTDRKLRPLPDAPDEHADLVIALKALLKKRRCTQLRHLLRKMGLEEGDRVTLAAILGADVDDGRGPDFDAADLERELRLVNYDPSDLSVGDVVEVTRMDSNAGTPGEPRRGVVRAVHPASTVSGATAHVEWTTNTWSTLEGREDSNGGRRHVYSVRLGRMNMMGEVHDIEEVAPKDVVDEELLQLRESILESAEIDEAAEELDVEEGESWTTSAGEAARATDLHARVTVSGPLLDEPVTVHCRNLFDAGWTASVEADLDAETEWIVLAAARNNSPIRTGVRL